MNAEYYGATQKSELEVNHLLGITASGREQDWEFEFADFSNIEKMLNILSDESLDLETKSALALLVIASFEEAFKANLDYEIYLSRAARLLSADALVLNRMKFYWLRLKRADDVPKVNLLLSTNKAI